MVDYQIIRGPGGYQGVLANLARREDADGFGASLLKFQADTDEAVDETVRGVAQYALRKVMEMSPVGNPDLWQSTKDAKYLAVYGTKAETFKFAREGYVGGRFKGDWQVTVDSPTEAVLPDIDPSGAATIAKGTATIQTAPRPREFWLTNNLPYSERLENGWSTQAPLGIVAVTMTDIGAAFEQQAAQALNEKGLA